MKIKRQELLSVLVTFLIGFIAGAYLYLVGYAPQFQASQGVDDAETSELVIVGQMYGGMRVGLPPSFQVNEDGTYRYLPFSENPDVPAPAVSGELPSDLRRAVVGALSERALTAAATEVTPEMCAQMVDGVDYRYLISFGGTEYRLDTCGTDFSHEAGMGPVLMELWTYFDTIAPPVAV